MARPKSETIRPEWFDLARYEAAHALDAAGWYLNLAVRRAIKYAKPGSAWVEPLSKFIRTQEPVLQARAPLIGAPSAAFEALWWSVEFPRQLDAILHGEAPPRTVRPLTAEALYHFERLLPEDIRNAAKTSTPHPSMTVDLDEQFNQQYMGSFVRVFVNAPDRQLVADFLHWLAHRRKRIEELSARSPRPPFLATIEALSPDPGGPGRPKRYKPKLDTFASCGVLPLLDIEQWRMETSAGDITNENWDELLGEVGAKRVTTAKKNASFLMSPFALEGWLGPLLGGA